MREPLTRQQVSALRDANGLVFERLSDGTNQIRAIVRGPDHQHEVTHEIPVFDASLTDYAGGHGEYTAFHYEMFAGTDAAMRTVVRAIKPGHYLVLKWVRSNQSPVLDEAGLVRDEVYLTTGTPTKAETFLIAVQVGKDNSARMIRRGA
jgi:hypothetical protein